MAGLSDSEIMAMLGDALSPNASAPDNETLARLHATLADLAEGSVGVGTVQAGHRSTIGGLRRRVANHASKLFVVAATVATAAVATDTLPGPTRNIAYDLGLPVTSPALFHAKQNLAQLKKSIVEKNHDQVIRLGQQLARDLTGLNQRDLSEIRDTAEGLLNDAGLPVPSLPEVTRSSTPTTTIRESTRPDSNDSDPIVVPGDGGAQTSPLTTTTSPKDSSNSGDPSGESSVTLPDSQLPSLGLGG
jgi:hypothetical protein